MRSKKDKSLETLHASHVLMNNVAIKQIRLAYVLGSLRTMYEHEYEHECARDAGGDVIMFVIPPDVQADIVNEGDDVYQLGKVTKEDVVSTLKIVYGDNYDYWRRYGLKLRKKK